MSLLPQQIPPQTEPLATQDDKGNLIISVNWWLYLFNIGKQVLSGPTAPIPATPAAALALFDTESDDVTAPLPRDVINALVLASDTLLPDRGPPGAAGPMGAPGVDGDPGDDGLLGPPGIAGQQGIAGIPGFALDGEDGADGVVGAPGAAGAAGAVGATGPAGAPAIIILDGEQGEEGMFGPPGPIATGFPTFTKFLLHFDGTNGATSTTDVEGHTVVFHSTAALSTTQVKFGTTSLLGPYITINDTLDLHTETDFCIEGWVYMPSTAATFREIIGKQANGSAFGLSIYIDTSNKFNANVSISGGAWTMTSTSTGAIATATWKHFALQRRGNLCSSYFDGALVTSSTTVLGPVWDDGSPWCLGANFDGSSPATGIFFDEFRLSAIARYSGATYVIPTSAFTPD